MPRDGAIIFGDLFGKLDVTILSDDGPDIDQDAVAFRV
jgi:hypothetical protein